MLVCLDAGHGGTDVGAVGANKSYEKNVALNITKKLGSALKRHGISVIYTREKDIEQGKMVLSERTKFANQNKADYFISVHNNASTSKEASGIETFSYKNTGTASNIAKSVQDELIKATGCKNRGVKTENFYVLKYTNMPAILVECCFISNPDEEKKLNTDEFVETLAEAICKGFLSHVGIKYKEEEKEVPKESGCLYTVQVGAFSVKENAEKTAEKLKSLGFASIVVKK